MENPCHVHHLIKIFKLLSNLDNIVNIMSIMITIPLLAIALIPLKPLSFLYRSPRGPQHVGAQRAQLHDGIPREAHRLQVDEPCRAALGAHDAAFRLH